jgi:hypothetical protein
VHAVSGGLDSSVLLCADTSVFSEYSVKAATMRAEKLGAFEPPHQLEALERKSGVQLDSFDLTDRCIFDRPERFNENLCLGPRDYPADLLLQDFFEYASRRGEEIVMGADADGLFSANHYEVASEILASIFNCGAADWSSIDKAVEGRRRRIIRSMIGVLLSKRKFGRRLKSIIRAVINLWYARNETLSAPTWRAPGNWVVGKAHSFGDQPSLGNRPARLLGRYRGWAWELTMRTHEFYRRQAGRDIVLPFMDTEVVEFCVGMPATRLTTRGLDRTLLRDAFKDLVPQTIRSAPKSGWFDGLVERDLGWKARGLVEDLFDGGSILQSLDLVDGNEFLEAHSEYSDACLERQTGSAVVGSSPIWRTVSAEIWLRGLDNATLKKLSWPRRRV